MRRNGEDGEVERRGRWKMGEEGGGIGEEGEMGEEGQEREGVRRGGGRRGWAVGEEGGVDEQGEEGVMQAGFGFLNLSGTSRIVILCSACRLWQSFTKFP